MRRLLQVALRTAADTVQQQLKNTRSTAAAAGMGAALRDLRQLSRTAFTPRYLLYTNVTISVVLSSVGDQLEQQYELLTGQLSGGPDAQRTAHMALSGGTVGVVCHYWYRWLDRRIPGRSLRIVLQKVLLDQLICSPLVIGTFFVTLGLLERASWDEMVLECKEKAWRLYAAEWVVWPPAQVANFYVVPPRFRVLYDNTISLGYDVYTSKVKHGGRTKGPAEQTAGLTA